MDVGPYLPLIAALFALLAGLAIGKAWERYKLRDGRWIDRRKARDSQHYVLGLNFLVSNQIDLAIEELSRAARVDTDALEIHMILGNVYRERGQVSRAIQVHQALLQRPKLTRLEHSYVLLCLGLDYKRGGFVDRSLEAFKEVLRLSPNNHYALLYLQKLHEEQHQWAEAYRIRRQLVDLSGPDTQPRNQAILAFLENALGADALKDNRRADAARHFEAAVHLDSSTTPAYLNLGDVRLLDGDAAGAREAWEQLIEVSPERVHLALERLERLFDQQGVPERFAERCRRFIASRPQDWRARLALGSHLSRSGQPRAALDLLLDALEQNPHGLTVHQAVWTVLLQLDLDRALVQRYIESARDAVFFLDPHVCLKCHYRSTELLWQCPHCHEWNSFVEERMAAARQSFAEL
ncbi:MAG TPA: tetratricopeptide repeat protein [Vicinamibacterales bacterium]|nr:tetratricopeptide repeat protein [Vicinamibacterales bacterium]